MLARYTGSGDAIAANRAAVATRLPMPTAIWVRSRLARRGDRLRGWLVSAGLPVRSTITRSISSSSRPIFRLIHESRKTPARPWPRGRRENYRRTALLTSPALPSPNLQHHRGDGLRHDRHVLHHALALQVLEIVAHLRAHVVEAGVVAQVDLREAGNARLDALTKRILANVLTQARHDARALRTR